MSQYTSLLLTTFAGTPNVADYHTRKALVFVIVFSIEYTEPSIRYGKGQVILKISFANIK